MAMAFSMAISVLTQSRSSFCRVKRYSGTMAFASLSRESASLGVKVTEEEGNLPKFVLTTSHRSGGVPHCFPQFGPGQIQQLKKIHSVMFLRRLSLSFPQSRRYFSSNPPTHDFSNSIMELNREMESIFGEPPSSHLSNLEANECAAQEVPHQTIPQKEHESPVGLTHVGTSGRAQMVDVSHKGSTKRTAVASCKVILGKNVYDLVLANQIAKGDVLSVARIAGISGAKHTSTLIPLCHNITLSHVHIDLRLNPEDWSVDIKGEAVSTGKTGVEMEALSAVSIAGLTVYDMCKAASKGIQITDLRLESKTGGKSGDWYREE